MISENLGIRSPRSDELSPLLKFLNSHLRPNVNWSIDDEYPNLFLNKNLHNMKIAIDGQQILSHAIMKPTFVKTPVAVWQIAAIGSVVTRDDQRNKGLSTKVIQACLQEAKNQSCDLAILWTDLYDFYRKLNFELAGVECSVLFDKKFSEQQPVSNCKIILGPQVDPYALQKLHLNHTVSCPRTIEEIQNFLRIPNSEIYSSWNEQGQLVSYAVIGKGLDFTNYVHEWAGSLPEVMNLMAQIVKRKNESITMITPAHSQNLIRECKKLNLHLHQGYLGMISIVNETSVFGKIKKYVRSKGFSDFVCERLDQEIIFGFKDQLLQVRESKNLLPLIFGPVPEGLPVDGLAEKKMKELFPMPLWLWGWDSI